MAGIDYWVWFDQPSRLFRASCHPRYDGDAVVIEEVLDRSQTPESLFRHWRGIRGVVNQGKIELIEISDCPRDMNPERWQSKTDALLGFELAHYYHVYMARGVSISWKRVRLTSPPPVMRSQAQADQVRRLDQSTRPIIDPGSWL